MRTVTALYSETPVAFKHEARDCAVRAVRVACQISYEDAHRQLKGAGRADRDGTWNLTVTKASGPCGLPLRKMAGPGGAMGDTHRADRTTLAQFVKANPAGRFVIRINTHFIALVDGIVHNWKVNARNHGPRARVICAWEVA